MNAIKLVVLSNIICIYVIGKYKNLNRDKKVFSLAITLSAPTIITILASKINFLNRAALTTNVGVVLSLTLCVASSFYLRLICVSDYRIFINSRLLFLIVLSGYAVLNGLMLSQSWLAQLGILLIQLNAVRWSISSQDFFSALHLAILIILILLLISSFQAGTLVPCRQDKCLIYNNVFSGLVGGNGLGLDLFVLYCALLYTSKFSMQIRIFFYLSSMMVIFTTSSRTAILSFIFCSICYEMRRFLEHKFFMTIFVISTICYSAYPLWGHYTEKAFTERGALWLYAKSLIGDAGLVGFGTSFWTRLGVTQGFVANYGTHNMWLDVLVSLGYLGLIILLCILASFFIKKDSINLKILVACLIFSGMNESTFILWKLYPVSIVLIVLSVIERKRTPT